MVEKYAENVGYIGIGLDEHRVGGVSEKDWKQVNIGKHSDGVVDVNRGRRIDRD